jgi:hypothetical protein
LQTASFSAFAQAHGFQVGLGLPKLVLPKGVKMAKADLGARKANEGAATKNPAPGRKPYEPPTLAGRGCLSALVAGTTVTFQQQT